MYVPRSSFAITYAVWKALFLREAVTRISPTRTAWIWLLIEPIFHISYMMVIFSVIRLRTIGGIDTAIWLMVGLLAFFAFRRTATQADKAVGSNKALFFYRQIKPVDCVLVRSSLELFLMVLISLALFLGAGMMGYSVMPADPFLLLSAFLGMWLAGLGFGLITSVITELLPEVGKLIGLALMPLYLLSGVIFPLSTVPPPYRDWLLLNPLIHGVEAARVAMASYYHAMQGINVSYLFISSLVMIFTGLALHRRYEPRLVMQ